MTISQAELHAVLVSRNRVNRRGSTQLRAREETPSSIFQRAVRSIQRHGPVQALRWAWFNLCEDYYEQRLGIITCRNQAWNRRAYEQNGDHVQYEPLPYPLINRFLPLVGSGTVRNDVFLDYGSGMGRVVIMAATLPFKRVIGVELMLPLLEIAAQNVRSANGRLRSKVQFVCANATEFSVPDDVSVIHLFNPFTGNVMLKVQRRIRESLERAPRSIKIVYAHPNDQPNMFNACPWVRLQHQLDCGVMSAMNLMVYESRA